MFFFSVSFGQNNVFLSEQLKSARFKKVYNKKDIEIRKLIKAKQLNINSLQLLLRVFKQEDTLEVWGRDKNNARFTLLKSYKICQKSGGPGPKRKEGDGQVPEGFYSIQGFNPDGTYYLTLFVNYPNASDKILSDKKRPGGDICIHGKCVTIGCIPMTDPQIEEIYTMCIEAHANGQAEIPTHIFPCRLKKEKLENLMALYDRNAEFIEFWKNLKIGYDYFEKNKSMPLVLVNVNGAYVFK